MKKPLGWWYHKIMCELGYFRGGSGGMYHKHLMIMLAFYEINLYGQSLPQCKIFKDRFKKKYNNFLKRLI